MATGNNNFIYNEFMIFQYINTLPLRRKVLARHLERYKVTKREYDEWVYKKF